MMKKTNTFSSGDTLGLTEKEKEKLFSVFEVDYDFYFKNNQGLFVLQTNMKYKLYKEIKKTYDYFYHMTNIPQFNEMKKELFREDLYRTKNTLCFDIQNVFIRKINILDHDEYKMLAETMEFEISYVVIKNKPSNKELLERLNDGDSKQGLQNLYKNKLML